jgi:hypothetical protein
MIKIFVTVRNRLAITKKCIEAIDRHTSMKHNVYVYNNATNYLLDQHFKYFHDMYKQGKVNQVTFTSKQTTFNAFSKASTCNFFGRQHEEDPDKDKCEFLLFLDNDIILLPKWDLKIQAAWHFVKKNGFKNVKVIGQLPGGIKGRSDYYNITDKMKGRIGILGGSGLWTVQTNFFTDVGFLNLKVLVGQDKKHDQLYWEMLKRASGGNPYIMGVNHKLGVHCGLMCGSVCNKLTKNRLDPKKEELIKFEESEREIDGMDFDTFLNKILNDERLARDW